MMQDTVQPKLSNTQWFVNFAHVIVKKCVLPTSPSACLRVCKLHKCYLYGIEEYKYPVEGRL